MLVEKASFRGGERALLLSHGIPFYQGKEPKAPKFIYGDEGEF
jgi:hypothetical protein